MEKTIWAQARRRALAETLELVRLDSGPRIVLTLGTPALVLGGLWAATGNILPAAGWTLIATLVLAVLVFFAKLINAPAKLAADATARLAQQAATEEAAERERRRYVIEKLTALYVEQGVDVTPAIKAGVELPPEDWLNEQLSAYGEGWHVFGIVGSRYQTFEIVDGDWRYRGRQLASPTAIMWAVFFDRLDVSWDVGSDHWQSPDGWAPDFLLGPLKAWFVVAPPDIEQVAEKCRGAVSATGRRVIVGRGQPAYGKENLSLYGDTGLPESELLAWGEDRRDKGVYWLLKVDGSAAVKLGGPGRATDHDREPIIGDVTKAAVDAARRHPSR